MHIPRNHLHQYDTKGRLKKSGSYDPILDIFSSDYQRLVRGRTNKYFFDRGRSLRRRTERQMLQVLGVETHWCPDCDTLRDHLRVSPYYVECTVCREASERYSNLIEEV